MLLPVREYIKLRRLARVTKVLENKNKRILDIALDCGFGSHETLTRAFKEAYGMTPEQYRENPVSLNQFEKPDLSLGYTLIDEGVPLISDGLVLEINRRTLKEPINFMGVIGYVPIVGQLPVGESTGVDIPGETWGRFHREKSRIPCKPNGRELGVAYIGDAPEGHFTYFAGAEVDPKQEKRAYPRVTFSLSIKGVVEMKYRIEKKEPFTIVGVKQRFSHVDGLGENIGKMWSETSPETFDQINALGDTEPYGLLGVYSGMYEDNTTDYYIATTTKKSCPKNLSKLDIPSLTWAVFEITGPMPTAMAEVWGQNKVLGSNYIY